MNAATAPALVSRSGHLCYIVGLVFARNRPGLVSGVVDGCPDSDELLHPGRLEAALEVSRSMDMLCYDMI